MRRTDVKAMHALLGQVVLYNSIYYIYIGLHHTWLESCRLDHGVHGFMSCQHVKRFIVNPYSFRRSIDSYVIFNIAEANIVLIAFVTHKSYGRCTLPLKSGLLRVHGKPRVNNLAFGAHADWIAVPKASVRFTVLPYNGVQT